MNCELISVGTELLMGNILNTNAQYISQRLADLGIDCYLQTTVGDNHDRLREAVLRGLERSDLIILTGGLGPTGDDLTKETVSDAFGRRLILDEASLDFMKKRFEKMCRPMTPNNDKQAMFPEGCIILSNPNGTAPGCIVEENGKAAILMPGPPKEMKPMFDDSVMPYLEARSGHMLYSRMVRIFGMGESTVEYKLLELINGQTNPTIAPYALSSEVKLRVTARCRTKEEGEGLVMPMIERIKAIVGDVVYSVDDEELHEACAAILKERKLTLAVAESCTGGMLSSKLISVSGSSAFFIEGAVTYCDSAKMRRLGVYADTLEAHSAVSAEVAAQMAQGIRAASGADFALATTGYAGPDGGTADKPVGTVFIALACADGTDTQEFHFTGNRERIRNVTCLNALDMLRRKLTC